VNYKSTTINLHLEILIIYGSQCK